MREEENLNQITKVLIVKNQGHEDWILKWKRDKGYKIDTVCGFHEAEVYLNSFSCDVILLHVGGLSCTEFDTLREVVSVSNGIPIIAILDNDDEELIHKAIRSGAQECLCTADVQSEAKVLRTVRQALVRKEGLERFRHTEEALRLSQDMAGMGSWIWHPHTNRFIPGGNFQKIWKSDDSNAPNSFIDFLHNIIREDRAKIVQTIRACKENLEQLDFEFRITDGSRGLKYLYMQGQLLSERRGDPVYYGTIQDVTRLRVFTNDLDRRNRILEITSKVASLGGWEINLKNDEVFWSQAMYKIHEVSEDFIPTVESSIAFYSDEARIEIQNNLYDAIHKSQTFSAEIKLTLPNRPKKWVYCTGTPVFEKGELVKITGVLQDITENHQRMEAMRIRAKMLDNVGEASMAFDKNSKIIFWNKAAEKLFKYKRHEVLGRTFSELQIGKIPKATVKKILSLLKKGQNYSGEFIMKDKKGREFPVYSSNSPLLDDEGEIATVLNISKDISKERATLKQIAESEDRFRKLFELSPIGKGLTDLNTGRWLDSNKTFLRLLGYSKKEFTKLTVYDITPAEFQSVDQKEMSKLTKTGRYGPYQKEYIKKDGTRLKVLITGFVLDNKEGRKAWTHVLDITELEEKSEALTKSEERFREYVEHASDVFLTITEDGTVTYMSENIYPMLGYKPTEIVGKSIFDYMHLDAVRSFHKMYDSAMNTKESSVRGTYRFKHKSGFYKYIQGQGKIRHNDNGECYTLLIARDMDYERKTELHVREQNRKLKDIAFIQSHIVRRPLSNILGLIEINQMNRDLPEDIFQIINLIKKEAEVMDQIIAEIVDKSTALTNLPDYDE